jgi:hypothetical protein
LFKQQGIKKHEASCKAQEEAERDGARAARRYEQALNEQLRLHSKHKNPAVAPSEAATSPSIFPPAAEHDPADENVSEARAFEGDEGTLGALEPESHNHPHSPGPASPGSGTGMSIVNSADDQQRPVLDEDLADFKTEYHPRSKRPTLFQTANEFRVRHVSKPTPDPTPWHPFRCKGDFEFAEIALEASLNKEQVEALLNLISRVAKGEAQVTFANEAELRKACDWAAEELTPFVKHTVNAQYKREELPFEVHVRSVWQWALDLLKNPHLAPHFVWDAECLYKHDGGQFERFYDEPWTADRWWDIQVGCITAKRCYL